MPETYEQKTIRDHLLGMVADHLGKGLIQCGLTQQVGCELVSLLSAYREEDRRLFPQVYLFGPSAQDLIRALAPGIPILAIGEYPDDSHMLTGPRRAATAALKNCASLAINGWCVYIKRGKKGFSYGLFQPAAETYSAGAEETLAASELPAAILRQSAENTVEIVNSTGGRLEISLTTASAGTGSMSEHVKQFAKAVCSEVRENVRPKATGYLARVLTEFLREGHGSLLVAVPSKGSLDRKKLSDGVILGNPIPLIETMLAAIKGKSGTETSLLRSQESLLRGMMASDGVTVFGTDGSIKGFRVFVQQNAVRRGGSPQPSTGGARSRAFSVLREYVGSTLHAALFRSQDGRTEVVVK